MTISGPASIRRLLEQIVLWDLPLAWAGGVPLPNLSCCQMRQLSSGLLHLALRGGFGQKKSVVRARLLMPRGPPLDLLFLLLPLAQP